MKNVKKVYKNIMSTQAQALVLALIVLVSLTITRTGRLFFSPSIAGPAEQLAFVGIKGIEFDEEKQKTYHSSFEFERPTFLLGSLNAEGGDPRRKWDVLDPELSAISVLVQSLENNFPFFHYNTYRTWPIASITKLLTALVVFEEIGIHTKIPISRNAASAPGVGNSLISGEIYTAKELLQILLISSNNGAAVAFEEYVGSRERFIELMNRKTRLIGMNQTILFDASGLSDLNQSSASDLLKLLKFIIKNRPEIITWTRTPEFLTRPTNLQFVESKNVRNVNELVHDPNFLGGKTGTLPRAKQNIMAIMSLNGERVAIIILGSSNRTEELEKIFNWIKRAYTF